ncbi:M24 family metallopeptidase [Lacticaseibacillus brantae]|nr:Xaa-Pro peptidase family protein [Lacticaseibacillus brantae]
MTRIAQLQQQMARQALDGMVVTEQSNVRYLTGFTGEETYLLVTPDAALLITDSRFVEQAKLQTKTPFMTQTKGLTATIADLIDRDGLHRIGFEDTVSYSDYAAMSQHGTWVATTNLVGQIREVKDAGEVALLQKAIDITMLGYEHVIATIRPGMTEQAVANDLEFFMREQGAEGVAFETIVASGARGAMPHGAATDKIIAVGDVVTLDFGAQYQGYMADITRTFAVGAPDTRLIEAYRIVFAAQQAGAKSLAPGVTGQAIDKATRDVIDTAGYGKYFGHGTGHGIGLSIHEGPGAWRPYKHANQATGNVETIEPGIYLPGIGGIRIEDDFLITAAGSRQLSPQAPPELLIIK